ncbi:hypothetical protein BsWGS_25907 [Bradybaena similaris]
MTMVSESQLLLLLMLLVTMASVSLGQSYVDGVLARTACAPTSATCSNQHKCCSSNDVCMYIPQHPYRYRCVTWQSPRVIYPLLARGATCSDSFQCLDRCCSEHRAYRRAPTYECDTPFNNYGHVQPCITH